MPKISVSLDFKPSLKRVGDAIGNLDLDKELHAILTDFALTVESYAKQVTPVDTGRLRASIGTSFLTGSTALGGTAIVAPHTNYAGFVHEGTRFMKGRPFMLHGANFARDRFEKEIPLRLDKAIRQKLSNL